MKLKNGDYDDSAEKAEQGNSTLVKYLRSKVSPDKSTFCRYSISNGQLKN